MWTCTSDRQPVDGDAGEPLRKVATCAIVHNPFARRGFVADLSDAFEPSAKIGTILGRRCTELLGAPVQSYGKAAIAGTAGDQEHANAFLTAAFGDAFREAIGGGAAWITSTTKVAGPGTMIDVPLAFKDEIWVRSHYDTLTVGVPDAPRDDEIVVIAAVANRSRINARLGGLSLAEATAAPDRKASL
jgi:hypothetical protein